MSERPSRRGSALPRAVRRPLCLATVAFVSSSVGCGRCGDEPPRDSGAAHEAGSATPSPGEASPGEARRHGAAVADLERLAGDVRWREASVAAWATARVGLELRPADTVQTMASGLADIRFRASSALARLGPDTTLRVPDQPPEVVRLKHLRGPLVARIDQGQAASRMEVELPAGTLVLDAPGDSEGDAGAGRAADAGPLHVEARVEVDEERTEVAMVRGAGTLSRREGEPLRIEEEHFVEVRNDGEVLESGPMGPIIALHRPGNDAAVRTRRVVRLEWVPEERAEGYRIVATPVEGEPVVVEARRGASHADLALGEGNYLWTVHAIVGGEAARAALPRSITVEVDDTPPALQVSSPEPGATVRGAGVPIEGRTEPGATLTVDSRPVPVTADGRFSYVHPVPRGLVNIVIRATDDLGNARTISRAVLRR